MIRDDLWYAIALLGLVATVWATRSLFLWLPARLQPGPALERALRHAPLASLVALIAPELLAAARLDGATVASVLADGRLVAGLVALGVAAWRRNALSGLLAGTAVYWGLVTAFG